MYTQVSSHLDFTPEKLVCSGNGLRKSEIWRGVFSNAFNLPANLPIHSEEAAVGACIFAGAAAGLYDNIKLSQDALLR